MNENEALEVCFFLLKNHTVVPCQKIGVYDKQKKLVSKFTVKGKEVILSD
jgi:hypothetical protein